METILKFLSNKNIYESIITIVIGFSIYFLIGKVIGKIVKRSEKEKNKKKKTYIRLLKSIVQYTILILIFILVLKINGVDIGSVAAGVGLISVIAGLALQDALKDIIMGFNLIVDNYFSVGDVLKLDDIEGKVVELGLKATKIKDVINENIYTIANRNISQALVKSEALDIDIPLPYEEKMEKMETLIGIISNKIAKIENVKAVQYKGIEKFDASSINYKLRILAKPEYHCKIKWDANRIIKKELDDNKVSIPYMQIDIHNKN